MKVILTLVFSCLCLIKVYPQEHIPDSVFIKLNNGTVYYGNDLSIKNNSIFLDGSRFRLPQVAFFKDNKGVFYGCFNNDTSKAIKASNNLFFFREKSGFMDGTGQMTKEGRVSYMYSYGMNHLRFINYFNAKAEIRNHAGATKYLEKARNKNKGIIFSLLTNLAGTGLIFLGDNIGSTPVLLTGIGMNITGISCFIGFVISKERNVYRAFKAYSGYGFDNQRWLIRK